MKYDPDNLFAKIIRGEVPSVKVYEDDTTYSFMDIFPQTRGHTLVIPKRAHIDLLHTEDTDIFSAIATTKKVAKAVDKALKPDGIMIGQFNRAAAGQTVFHLHFHILPRYEGIKLEPHAGGAPANTGELQELADLIKAEL